MTYETVSIYSYYPELTEKEQLTKLLDDVLCLFALTTGGFEKIHDYSCVTEAFNAIRKAREFNPRYPCTMLLSEWLKAQEENK